MKKKVFADNIWGEIYTSKIEQYFISTKIFNRLHHIHQTSMLYFVYPTMTITRFEHSLGTMLIAGRMFDSCLSNADIEDVKEFLDSFKMDFQRIIESEPKIKEWCKGEVGELQDFFKNNNVCNKEGNVGNLLSNNITLKVKDNLKVYAILLQAIRIVALLHDLGHPPYSHVVESAIVSIKNNINDKKNTTKREKAFLNILGAYTVKQHLHESIGDNLIEILLDSINYDSEGDDKEDKVFLHLVINTVHKILDETKEVEENKYSLLHKLISGDLDADRLDFLVRCAKSSGLHTKINANRIIDSYCLIKEGGHFYWGINSKYIHDIEIFLTDYIEHYEYLISHHAYVKLDKLMQEVIINISLKYLSSRSQKDLNWDKEIVPIDCSGLWKSIKKEPKSNKKMENRIIQWDDNWLMVVLKKYYYDNIGNIIADDKLRRQIEEILSNKKNYISVIKRRDDFRHINKKIFDHFFADEEMFKSILLKIKTRNILQSNSYSVEQTNIIIKKFKDKEIESNLKILKDMIADKEYNEIENFSKKIYNYDNFLVILFQEILCEIFLESEFNSRREAFIQELEGRNIKIDDIFLVKGGKNLNTEYLNDTYRVYEYIEDNNYKLYKFNDYYNIKVLGEKFRPNWYYCYILPHENFTLGDNESTYNIVSELIISVIDELIREEVLNLNA